jgi:hypothetical protein
MATLRKARIIRSSHSEDYFAPHGSAVDLCWLFEPSYWHSPFAACLLRQQQARAMIVERYIPTKESTATSWPCCSHSAASCDWSKVRCAGISHYGRSSRAPLRGHEDVQYTPLLYRLAPTPPSCSCLPMAFGEPGRPPGLSASIYELRPTKFRHFSFHSNATRINYRR